MSSEQLIPNGIARGIGISTRQMKQCQKDAIFVVHSAPQIGYFEGIKRKIGRPDIEIVTVGQIAGGWHYGRIYRQMVIDHYAQENLHPDDVIHVYHAVLMATG